MSGPLAGLRVLDLTTVVLGPYATQILGDYGADVIKIERPGGDPSRYMSPGRSRGMSGIAMNLHRNKRSIVLDLKSDDDRDVFRRLIKSSDIIVHNMLPPVVEALDLAYETVHNINPHLIYCTATGFADGGPYSGKPAYDDLIQGVSGLAVVDVDDMLGFGKEQPPFGNGTDGSPQDGEDGAGCGEHRSERKRQEAEQQAAGKAQGYDAAQFFSVFAGNAKTHFLHQVVLCGVRHFELPNGTDVVLLAEGLDLDRRVRHFVSADRKLNNVSEVSLHAPEEPEAA